MFMSKKAREHREKEFKEDTHPIFFSFQYMLNFVKKFCPFWWCQFKKFFNTFLP